MMVMPDHIKELYLDWAEAQIEAEPGTIIGKPKELEEYLEERHRIIEQAEANGCMIG